MKPPLTERKKQRYNKPRSSSPSAHEQPNMITPSKLKKEIDDAVNTQRGLCKPIHSTAAIRKIMSHTHRAGHSGHPGPGPPQQQDNPPAKSVNID
ncbi:hypothetical protein PCANC_03045 [Puccinia coronata f. sp. avenae]|uniref:Uncharacterized protein n=1 Tax=Puccinia coronata f. sp. avenae TaxID=200324 RepID=A0A2N5W118_9BASI|nr:hypothetical protein PCANC_03045 [Puccinia coronata f. sp. avenae]